MILSEDDLKYLKENDGWIIWIDGEQIPVGPGFDYPSLRSVFDELVKEKGIEEASWLFGYDTPEEMVLDLAGMLDGKYTVEDLVIDAFNGKRADELGRRGGRKNAD